MFWMILKLIYSILLLTRLEAIESSLKSSAEESNKRVVESEVRTGLELISLKDHNSFTSGKYCGESG